MTNKDKERLRKQIGYGLYVARNIKDETQKEVEERSGIIRSNRLSQVELGKSGISAEEFIALCEYYDTSPDTVMDIDPKSPYKTKINGILEQFPDDKLRMVYKLLKTYIDNK